MARAKWTKRAQRKPPSLTATELWAVLVDGEDPGDVAALFDLDAQAFAALLAEALETEGGRLADRSLEQVYAEYVLAQLGCERKLSDMITNLPGKTTYLQARVAAMRAVSEINDKVLTQGIKLGVVAGDGGVLPSDTVAALSNDELTRTIVTELGQLQKLKEEYQLVDVAELKPGSLHRGPTSDKMEPVSILKPKGSTQTTTAKKKKSAPKRQPRKRRTR